MGSGACAKTLPAVAIEAVGYRHCSGMAAFKMVPCDQLRPNPSSGLTWLRCGHRVPMATLTFLRAVISGAI